MPDGPTIWVEDPIGDLQIAWAENQRLRTALAQAEAERIALADAFREYMEFHHISRTDAAMGVQDIIDEARAKHNV